MKLWLCGNDLTRIEEWMRYGVFEGILTNPDIIAAVQCAPEEFLREACRISSGPVFYQLKTQDEGTMMNDAKRILGLDSRIRIKIPATMVGMRTMAQLTNEGQEVLATCVSDLPTLLLAIRFGAKWITPYGSLWRPFVQVDKDTLVSEFQGVMEKQNLPADLIVGVKEPWELRRYALLGVQSFFVWIDDLTKFFDTPMVLSAEETFRKSWKAIECPGS